MSNAIRLNREIERTPGKVVSRWKQSSLAKTRNFVFVAAIGKQKA